MVLRASWTRQFGWLKHYPMNTTFIFHHEQSSPPTLTFSILCSSQYCCTGGFATDFLVNCWKWARKTTSQAGIIGPCAPLRGAGRWSTTFWAQGSPDGCPASWRSRWCHTARERGRLQSTQLDGDRQQEDQKGGTVSQQRSLPPSCSKCLFEKKTAFFLCFFCHPLV